MAEITDGIPGEGTILQMKVSAAFTAIANIDEIDGFEATAEAIDKFGLSDVVKKRRKSNVIDLGTMSLKLRADPNSTMHAAIYDKTVATVAADDDEFKIIFPDGNTTPGFATFTGFWTKYKLTGMKVGENIMIEAEIQVNSIPDFTDGATP